MAYPIANSPMFPSVSDAPFLPPKLKDMPVFNPGTRFYQCEDGSTRWMSENEAINAGMSCKVVSAPSLVGGFPVVNLGQASPAPAAPGAQGNPQGASIQVDSPVDQNPFVWPGYPIVSPLNYPATPAGTNCAWEEDTAGNDIYVCRPERGSVRAPALYAAGPVSYPVQTFFRGPF